MLETSCIWEEDFDQDDGDDDHDDDVDDDDLDEDTDVHDDDDVLRCQRPIPTSEPTRGPSDVFLDFSCKMFYNKNTFSGSNQNRSHFISCVM